MRTDGSNQGAKGPQNEQKTDDPVNSLKYQISTMAREFERALPGKIGVDRMMRIVMTAILNNPKLADCLPVTFFGALLQAMQLGLEVNTPLGHSYLIPYWNSSEKRLECQFQLGYQGFLELCYRSGKYKRIAAEVVYEGDIFDYQLGSHQFLNHVPKGGNGKPTHAWALYELDNGGEQFSVWTWADILKHAQAFSKSFDQNKKWASPWLSSEASQEGMAKKTVLKALLKYAPKSVEIASAAMADETTVIAKKYDVGNDSHLHFDLQFPQIEGPSQEAQDAQNLMNQANASRMEGAAAKEKVPVQQAQAATPGTTAPTSPTPATASAPAGKGKASGLFANDEDAALEEQYRAETGAGVDPPDFG